ncbi:hypothetical protein PMAYCL1PPCAC_14135, partial [Pristionchus mayeri]
TYNYFIIIICKKKIERCLHVSNLDEVEHLVGEQPLISVLLQYLLEGARVGSIVCMHEECSVASDHEVGRGQIKHLVSRRPDHGLSLRERRVGCDHSSLPKIGASRLLVDDDTVLRVELGYRHLVVLSEVEVDLLAQVVHDATSFSAREPSCLAHRLLRAVRTVAAADLDHTAVIDSQTDEGNIGDYLKSLESHADVD